MNDRTPSSSALRRRSVLTGAAWAAPVIAVAIAAPSAAASAPARPAERTGTIAFSPDTYRGSRVGDRVEFPELTGVVTVTSGALPAFALLRYSDVSPSRVDLRRDAGDLVPIDPATGRFSVSGVYNAVVDGDNPFGFVYAGIRAEETLGAVFGYTVAELIG